MGGLKNLFFKVVEDDTIGSQKPAKGAQPNVQPVMQPIAQQQSPVGGQIDATISQQLADALEQSNMPGFDYFEFVKALQAQESILPAEQLRFQAVYTMAATMGLTKEVLVNSANHYLGVLKNKETEFLTAVDSHTTTGIGGKEKTIADIDTQIQQKSEQIRKLTDEMNEAQSKKTALINEISAGKAEVERVKNNFYATLKVYTDKITSDIQKIQQYLGGTK